MTLGLLIADDAYPLVDFIRRNRANTLRARTNGGEAVVIWESDPADTLSESIDSILTALSGLPNPGDAAVSFTLDGDTVAINLSH